MRIAEDARPQVRLLLTATLVTLVLWFIPFADWLVYPIRLFVTFVHESCHAIVGALTGSSIKGLVVLPNGEGFVLAASSNWFSSLIIASAGYLGTTACGALLLMLIRNRTNPQSILITLSVLMGLVTFLFAFLVPFLNFFDAISFSNMIFTSLVGGLLTLALSLIALRTSYRTQNFVVAFLAVQLVLNAFLDLKTLFMLNAPLIGSNINTDATNMEQITRIPAIAWVVIWIALSVLIVSIVLRLYAIAQRKKTI